MHYEEITGRNIGVITEQHQQRIRDTKVGLLGAGGVGGMSALLIAQAGFGELWLCDNDVYEASNLNRQVLCRTGNLGQKKAQVARDSLLEHNPLVSLRIHEERLTCEKDMIRCYEGSDCLVVAADNLDSVVLATRAGRRLGIPTLVTCPLGWRCAVTTVMPNGPDYEELTNSPTQGVEELNDEVRTATRIYQRRYLAASEGFTEAMQERLLDLSQPIVTLSPVVNMTACLAVSELLKWRLEIGDVFTFPHYLTMDLRTAEPFSVPAIGRKMLERWG